jgi:hypothetical protein
MNKSYLILSLLVAGIFVNSIAEAKREPLIVKVQGEGAITSQPAGISCPSDCFENFRDKITVTLTATANPGSSFSGWGGACVGTDPVCVIKVKKYSVVTAIFSTTKVSNPPPETK